MTGGTATEQARYEGYTDFMAYAAELVAQHRAFPGELEGTRQCRRLRGCH
ncbi:hypothetical protein [Sphaerisporangium perillae]|nr:hypothetical protein [Sphaerisporangium perillae]